MSAVSDAIITYAILKKFNTPVKDTKAYKLGLVDDNGMPTRKSRYDHTETARDAYTLLDRLVFKLKRMWQNMPAAAKLIGGYAAALMFIKESKDSPYDNFSVFDHLDPSKADSYNKMILGESTIPYDQVYIIELAEDSSFLRKLVEAYEDGKQDELIENEVAGNSVSSGQVQGLAVEPIITKKKQKEYCDSNPEVQGLGRKVKPLL